MNSNPISGRTTTRRTFLRRSLLAGGAAALPLIVPGRVLGRDGGVAPSNRIALGGIGIGPRGRQVRRTSARANSGSRDWLRLSTPTTPSYFGDSTWKLALRGGGGILAMCAYSES